MTKSEWTNEEVGFQVDLTSGEVAPLPTTALADIGLSERRDLQQWISQYPEVVDRDLVLVTSEFDGFSIGEKRVSDRLDLLFVDSDGRPLVAELKRDRAPDTVDMQALKYAAYCSTLTVEELVEEYARFHDTSVDIARSLLLEHAPSLTGGELGPVRIRLVAGSFGPSVTSVVLWLRDIGLDIGCVQVSVRKPTNGVAVITARQLLPLPSAEEYVVRRRRRVQEEEKKEETARRRNAVTVLLEKELLQAGDVVRLKLDALTTEWRPYVENLIAAEPDVETAEWTGVSLRQALRWRRDGRYYSCSGLVETLLREVGFDRVSIPGPQFWVDASGRSLADRAREAEGENIAEL